jgi:hypothetical protein
VTDSRPVNFYRETRLRNRENRLDPEGKLPPEQRRALALEADRAFFKTIGTKSGIARRARAERLKLLEQAAIERSLAS